MTSGPARSLALGFAPHESVVDLIRAFIEDDLAATRADLGIAEKHGALPEPGTSLLAVAGPDLTRKMPAKFGRA